MADNPLETAAQNLGIQKPNFFIGQTPQPKIMMPQDPAPSGKWFCSVFLNEGLITRADYNGLIKGHALAAFTHGDFVHWYTKNGAKLVEEANRRGFSWVKMAPLAITRTKAIFEKDGHRKAVENYMAFCEGVAALFGKAAGIEPFQKSFYYSTWGQKLRGTIQLMKMKIFYRQTGKFVRSLFKFEKKSVEALSWH